MGLFETAVEEEIRKLRSRLENIDSKEERSEALSRFLRQLQGWIAEIDTCKDKLNVLVKEWETLLVDSQEETEYSEDSEDSEDFDFQETEEMSEEESEWR